MTADEMMIEEAVEVILEGKSTCDCDTCKGCGWINTKFLQRCHVCDGRGKKFNVSYVEACRVLDKPLPKLTALSITFIVGGGGSGGGSSSNTGCKSIGIGGGNTTISTNSIGHHGGGGSGATQ